MTDTLLVYVCESGGQAPEWIKVLPLGKVELRDGRSPFAATREDLARVVQVFRDEGVHLVIDYEHESLKGGKALAAGWIKDLEVREDGLYARVEWTEIARREIESRQYGYYSPVTAVDKETRRAVKLLHAALTNNPAIKNLPFLLAAKYGGDGEPEILILKDGIRARAKAVGMTINQEAKAMKQDIMKLLGLTGEKPDEEVLALADTRFKMAGALPEIAQAAGLQPEATVSEIKGTVLALKQGQGELVALTAKVTALETASAQGKAEAAVAEALEARKITPGEKEFALKYALKDLEAFKAWVAAKPEVMPGGQGLKTPKPGATGQEGLDSEQMAMCANAGVKPEAFKASHAQLIEQGLLKDGR